MANLTGVVRDWVLFRRRSFRKDALACLSRLEPGLDVMGRENIPQSGPCLVAFNHYSRPGFHAWWIALAVASQLPMEAHFVMTAELTFPGRWYAPVGSRLSRWVLKRGARVYGFTGMPPMPPREKDVAARAHAVRDALSFVDHTSRPVVCLAPEGGDNSGGSLAVPPSGVGRFILQLARRGLLVHPVGVWEHDGRLCIRFGSPYRLPAAPDLPAVERDSRTAGTVMQSIACLLPTRLRGEYL